MSDKKTGVIPPPLEGGEFYGDKVKAKLEAVESGISTIEREFFYDIVLPNGETIGEWMAPQLETAYQSGTMPPMLPMIE